MIILIDGYNVLRAVLRGRKGSDRERDQFLALLGRYAKQKKHKLVVVFDGGSYEWPHKERQHGVHVVFVGFNETADDYIKRYIKDHSAKDIVLASSDRELQSAAAHEQLPVIGGYTFYTFVQEAIAGNASDDPTATALVKTALHEDQELDTLMQEASKQVPVKSEDVIEKQPAQAQKKSKKERALIRTIKKL